MTLDITEPIDTTTFDGVWELWDYLYMWNMAPCWKMPQSILYG